VTFLASVGSLVLTFLAGAEIDPVSLRGHWKASLSIGAVSFALPFLAAFGFCKLVLGWQLVMVNAYRHPGSETILTWWVFIAAGLLDLPALQEHSLWVLYAYPVFFIVMGTGVLIATATGAQSAARRSTALAAAQCRPAEAGLPRTIGRAAAPRPSAECAAQLAAVLQAAEIPAGVRLAEATALLRAATESVGPGRTVAP